MICADERRMVRICNLETSLILGGLMVQLERAVVAAFHSPTKQGHSDLLAALKLARKAQRELRATS